MRKRLAGLAVVAITFALVAPALAKAKPDGRAGSTIIARN
jgi:hypothetical protein